jgi:hypothetical protein
MELTDLLNKTCVIGVSYFDKDEQLLKQGQYAGVVSKVDQELGISVKLQHSEMNAAGAAGAGAAGQGAGSAGSGPEFILPPNLAPWFKAPAGRYRHVPSGVDMENPDYLVTWCVYRTQETTAEGQHEWWEWVPNTEPPQVGQGG